MEPNSETFLCFKCKHFSFIGGCIAFDGDIPEEILSGEVLHTQPFPQQTNTLVFEPKEGA